MKEEAIRTKHLTPELLKKELVLFKTLKHYLPKIVVIHRNPLYEDEIKSELELVSKEINTEIIIGHEDLVIDL
jgi:hypothetical protein